MQKVTFSTHWNVPVLNYWYQNYCSYSGKSNVTVNKYLLLEIDEDNTSYDNKL